MKVVERFIDLGERDGIHTKLVIDHGVVIDFVVVQISEISGEAHQLVRYDCSHGYVHKDCLYARDGRKEELPDRPFDELYEMCVREVKSEWKNYRSQYLRNRWGNL